MTVHKVIKYGEPILKKKAKSVEGLTAEVKKIVADLLETLYASKGVGLAAPQIGFSQRICVIDFVPEGKKQPIVLINPRVVDKKGKVIEEEGCLSFPGIFANVKRYDKTKVEAINEKGIPIVIESTGYLSRAVQHEIDHLNGKLFIDYLSFFKKRIIKKEIENRKKAGTW